MGPVMWLQNTGLLDKFFIDSHNPPPVIPLKKVRDNEPLIIEQLVTAAIVLLVGLVLATLVFLGEHFRKRRAGPRPPPGTRGGAAAPPPTGSASAACSSPAPGSPPNGPSPSTSGANNIPPPPAAYVPPGGSRGGIRAAAAAAATPHRGEPEKNPEPPLTPVPETTVEMTEEEIHTATVDEANMTVDDEDHLLYNKDDNMNKGTAKLGGDAQAAQDEAENYFSA